MQVLDKETGTFEVVASTGDVDRDKEVIDPKGWELGNFRKNPVILWAHNYSELPIGIAEKIEQTDKGLVIKGRFASAEANPKAQQIKKLYEEGIQQAVSVGFIPLERDEHDDSIITKAELLELSFVPVPANPNALALAMSKGFDPKKDPELFEKAEHDDNPICDPNSDQYDPARCAELQRSGDKPKPKPKPKPKKDVAETIALAGVIDHLNFLADAFERNEVGKTSVTKMRKALTMLMEVLKEQANLGQKQFEILDLKQDEDETTDIQTLILSKERFETLEEAKTWIKDNDFRSDKVDETDNSFRFRQLDPATCKEDSFRTIEITDGVSAVICRTKAVAPQNTKQKPDIDNIGDLSASTSERATSQNTPDRDGGSGTDDDAVGDLSTTTMRELRKSTLQTYHACENILTITKRELEARNKNG